MTYETPAFIAMFTAIARSMEENRDHLCALDGVIGDADHGIAMQQGFAAVDKALAALDAGQASPTDVFNTAAKSFLNAVGASSGPLYATAMMRAGASLKGKATASAQDVALLIPAMTKGISDRGKAQPGDKTMLDAWQTAADRVLALVEQGSPLAQVLTEAVAAAEAGAQSTIPMEAKLGRSARLGQRSVGHIDAGAASAALVIKAISESFG
ncbi:dihydroxyacetone kinase subunit DhaL [Rhodobacter ferrooxidans]|uniref:Dihydroxyacetone kinase, L subunit n=1 Tax=Rhodobacter ferrooxidans TaxID=371731 RepID=C8S157_9RHOB|nr:dihydroxyacetone kinase subunit DhaL [Rhodobacter sp. SW2]EEW25255.1 dihydroxyacetone kinase, L subunit [Rhodobacter sp. SW2]